MATVQRYTVEIHDGTERSGLRATVELGLDDGHTAVVQFYNGGYAPPQAMVSGGSITGHLPSAMLSPVLTLLQGVAPVSVEVRDGRFVLATREEQVAR
jgi:hypothetical protein